MAYRVLKSGISQRVDDTDEFVDRKVGDIIEVSPESAKYLVPEGFIELANVTSDYMEESNA